MQAVPADCAITWWALPDEASSATATAVGLHPDSGLLMMVRDLPTRRHAGVHVRPFVVGADEAAWLAVNNAAFAAHRMVAGMCQSEWRTGFQQLLIDIETVLGRQV